MGPLERAIAVCNSTTFETELMKSNRAIPVSRQLGRARMGRPPKGWSHDVLVEQTRALAKAIKEGSGNLPGREIERILNIGSDGTGAYLGTYFARYLNKPTVKSNKAALAPDRLSQLAALAREKGWLPSDRRLGGIVIPNPFKHLEVPDGELLSERIKVTQDQRELLYKAQAEAAEALRKLIQTMNSCDKVGFKYTIAQDMDGEKINVQMDGIDADLNGVMAAINSASVGSNEQFGTGDLFS